MNPARSRDLHVQPYGRDEDSAENETTDVQHRIQPYYTQPFGVNERFLSPAPQPNYLPDQLFDRNQEIINHNGLSSYESNNDSSNLDHYSYVPVPQVHLPSQAAQFTVPINRGNFDSTGQQCPPGGRPRVSTTIWEDEGTLCFQVEARQVTVARREDNNMINGTKLLNVAKMSRGKRDGILKNEAIRSVIKVGSMHLKGVWIPFDRALELANKNHVTDMLYPLFVKDIKKFLYHPANYARTTAVLAAANHRQARQTQPNATGAESIPEERPTLDRSLSMPTPLDRSLSMLTPPSSASTNSDYWTSTSNHGPISETHARTHSLPGTPATTPPAPGYFAHHGQQQQPQLYTGTYLESRNMASSNRYGQQPDMQRSYNHSRNTSMMSYQEEDMSNESSHSLKENFAALQPRVSLQPINSGPSSSDLRFQQSHVAQRHSSSDALNLTTYNTTDSRLGPATPGHHRAHSRSQSKGSAKVFNTPNLTTQMGRRTAMTPSGSPLHGHTRRSSRDLSQSTQASIWVQQQQQLAYNTPQQSGRGHVRHLSGQLPQIYEETPSCRMAYQLHGHTRIGDNFPRMVENEQNYQPTNGSPVRPQQLPENIASPLTGKKKRERVISDPDQPYFQSDLGYDERQESLTPPPINRKDDQVEESPKRRKSERNGMHSRSGSIY